MQSYNHFHLHCETEREKTKKTKIYSFSASSSKLNYTRKSLSGSAISLWEINPSGQQRRPWPSLLSLPT